MIVSFRDQLAEDLFFDRYTTVTRKFDSSLRGISQRKLQYLNAASCLDDLRVPPGNRVERLRGDRDGQYSIRINKQWRIVFRWLDGAHQVEIVDYH